MLDVDILRSEPLTDLINEFKQPELAEILALLPRKSDVGRSVGWDILGTERDVDTYEGDLSPAGQRKLQVIGSQTAKLARTFKSVMVPGGVLMDLRSPGSEQRQRIAEERIGVELAAMARLLDRQNAFMILQALQGELPMTVDGVEHEIDYGFASSHKPTIGSGVAADWNDPGSDIVSDIANYKILIAQESGRRAVTAWTSDEVIRAMIKNDHVKEMFAGTQAGVQALTEGSIGRFMGLNWKVFDETFQPDGGSITRYLDHKKVIFAPAPDQEVAFMATGSDVIPDDDKKGMHEVIGRYSYGTLNENPASLALYAGEVRLPVIRIPNAFVSATVLAA